VFIYVLLDQPIAVQDTVLLKGLMQNLNLRTNLKLKYNIKSLNYIQKNYRFQAWFLLYWIMYFTFFSWSVVQKLLRKDMIV